MKDVIETNKYVELTYEVIDQNSGRVLTTVEFPLGYVHGVNTVLSPQVSAELEGRSAGETIEVPLDCNKIFGPRDESLVITEYIRNVPEEYREVGTAILMENDRGETAVWQRGHFQAGNPDCPRCNRRRNCSRGESRRTPGY
jgi:FKBP-type peptidyl-prolyl cis-trans isomerase SlyD